MSKRTHQNDKSLAGRDRTRLLKVSQIGSTFAGVQVSGRNSTRLDVRVNYPANQSKNPALFTKGGPSVIVRRPRSLRLERSSGGNGIERTVKPELTSGKKVPSYAKVPQGFLPCVSGFGLSNVVNRIALYKRV